MKNVFTVHIWDSSYSSIKGHRHPNTLVAWEAKVHNYTHCTVCDKLLPTLFYEVNHSWIPGWGFCCSEECINMYMLQKL